FSRGTAVSGCPRATDRPRHGFEPQFCRESRIAAAKQLLTLRLLRSRFESLLFPRRRVSVRRARLLFRRSNRRKRNTFPERKLSDSGLAHTKRSQRFLLEPAEPQ